MNGFLFCLLALVAVQLPQDNAGDLGWDIVDDELAIIVHVHPSGVAALTERNTIENEIPDFLKGRATSINILFSSDPPPRNPSRAEIERIFPLARRNVPTRDLMDMGKGTIANIDPEKKIDNNPIVATSATNVDPQSETRNRDEPRNREEGALPLLGNPTGGITARSDFGANSSRPLQPIQTLSTPAANQQNASTFEAFNSSQVGAPVGQVGTPVGQMTPNQQPTFVAMQNPLGNVYSQPNIGQVGMGRGQDSFNSDPKSLPTNQWQKNPQGNAYEQQRLTPIPPPVLPTNRLAVGATDNATNQSQIGWIMFIISLVFNVYMFFYLFKLRERYRALLTSVRTGVDSGY